MIILTTIHKAVERLPCKYLKMEDFPEFNEGAKPPRRIYGWMFDDSYMLALASRRGLSFEPGPHTRRLLGGHETFNFSDLTEEHFRNERLMRSLQSTAEWVVLLHFKSQTGLSFQVESAASPYKRVLVAWTNYDMGTTYASYDERRVGGWMSVKEFLDKEMNECLPSGTGRCELVWWWPTLLSRS